MPDGSITFSTALDNKELEKQLSSLTKKITTLENKIGQKQAIKLPLVEQSKQLSVQLDAASAKLYEMQSASKGAFSSEQIKEQKLHVSGLQSEWNRVQGKVESYDTSINNATIELDRAKETAGGVAKQLSAANSASNLMGPAIQRANKKMDQFKARLAAVVRSALVFTVITQGLAKLREWMGDVVQSNDEASAAIARLKGALLTLVQPLVNIVLPAFTAFVNVMADLIGYVASFVSIIFGMTPETASDAAKSLYGETKAIKGVGDAAKKASNSLARFDEIQKLTEENSGGGSGASASIQPDFSALKDLPSALKNLAADLAIKINELKFSWSEGKLAENQDAWIVALSAILGAVIGAMFGGLSGGVIGLLLGASIGIITATFLDKTENPSMYKDIFMVVLSSILGAVIGVWFGGLVGGVIGLLIGVTVGIIALEFTKGNMTSWDPQNTIIVVLSAILGAILGFMFGGITGAIIGLLLGVLVSFISIQFNEGKFDKDSAIASLRIALFAILGAILGFMFGGLVGGVVGLILGMTIGFASVAFDKELSDRVRSVAEKALFVCMTTIIGALIGAVFGGGVFGAIVGGIIGLSFGLAITLTSASITDKTGLSGGGGGGSRGSSSVTSSNANTLSSATQSMLAEAPRLATGAVIPPNREFMAVLGDQKNGTNIEAPMSTIEQGVENVLRRMGISGGSGGKQITVVLELNRRELGRVVYELNNDEAQRVGLTLA